MSFQICRETAVLSQIPWFLTFHRTWWVFEKCFSNFHWQMLKHAGFFLPCSLSSSCLRHGLLPKSTSFEYHPSRMTSQCQQKMTILLCDAYLWDYYIEASDVPLHMAVMLKAAPCHTSLTCLSVCSPKWVTSLLMQGICLLCFPLEGNTTAITLSEKQSKLVNKKGREEKSLKWHLA